VVICHGAGANKGNFAAFLHLFAGEGYNALIFDFRGHGESDGHTCTFGLEEWRDVKAAVDYLCAHRRAQARQVIGWGSSMGAMALIRTAASDARIEAVVLDSCFASARVMAHQMAPAMIAEAGLASLSMRAGRSFGELTAVPAVKAFAGRPIFLIHGQDDEMIDPANLDILFEAAGEPKEKWLGPGPHSNILTTAFAEYQRRVLGFLEQTLPNAETSSPSEGHDGGSASADRGR